MSKDIKYFHETVPLNGRASVVPIYEEGKDGNNRFVGTQDLDLTLYFDPYVDPERSDNTLFAQSIGSLTIPTGADEITWGYGLNTKRTSTYGGEVVQILSMYADKMVIKGTCRNYKELSAIYKYFKDYMSYVSGALGVGLDRRQNFLQFRYPARDWSFLIMVMEAPNMRMATAQAAPQWEIVAEIVSENDRIEIGSKRIDEWANTLDVVVPPVLRVASKETAMSRRGGIRGTSNSQPAETGAAIKGAYKNFVLKKGADPFGDAMQYATGGKGAVADNFETMIASYTTGTISSLRTNPLNAPDKSAADIYSETYGTEIAFTSDGSGGTGAGGAGGGSTLSGTLDPKLIAALAAMAFRDIGTTYPNSNLKSLATNKTALEQAVGISYKESGWTVEAIHHNVKGTDPPNPTLEEFLAGPSTTIPKSQDTAEGNYDLGLWQINNYWNTGTIATACGYSGSDVPGYTGPKADMTPPAGGSDWTKVAKICVNNDYFHQMLTDAYANAKAMAFIYSSLHWKDWTTNGQGISSDVVTKISKAVADYLANPQTYEQQVLSGGAGGTLTQSGKEALGKLKTYIQNGSLILDHDNDKQAILNGTGVVIGNVLDANARVQLNNDLLICVEYIVRVLGLKIHVGSFVGTHPGPATDPHLRGMGVDIYQIGGIDVISPNCKANTIALMKLLNNLTGTAKPPRLICNGNGSQDPTVRQYDILLDMTGEAACAAYGSDTMGGHQNHVHVGYNREP